MASVTVALLGHEHWRNYRSGSAVYPTDHRRHHGGVHAGLVRDPAARVGDLRSRGTAGGFADDLFGEGRSRVDSRPLIGLFLCVLDSISC